MHFYVHQIQEFHCRAKTAADSPADRYHCHNPERKMLSDIWDGKTPIRQVGIGLSKLTHENAFQMSMFEDPDMEYYREWDRLYDESNSKN